MDRRIIDKSKVSVIIPVYNGQDYLAQAIQSILKQSTVPGEIVIIDDGSTDDTARVVSPFAKRVKYVYQSNQGPASARNTGLALAGGAIIAFLDSDDIWPEGKMASQLQHFHDVKDADVVIGLVQMLRMTNSTESLFEPFANAWFSCNLGSALFKRSAFDQVGWFDTDLSTGEDLDWFIRAREQDLAIATMNMVTLWYRIHDRNVTQDQEIRNHNALRALKKTLDRRRKILPERARNQLNGPSS